MTLMTLKEIRHKIYQLESDLRYPLYDFPYEVIFKIHRKITMLKELEKKIKIKEKHTTFDDDCEKCSRLMKMLDENRNKRYSEYEQTNSEFCRGRACEASYISSILGFKIPNDMFH